MTLHDLTTKLAGRMHISRAEAKTLLHNNGVLETAIKRLENEGLVIKHSISIKCIVTK